MTWRGFGLVVAACFVGYTSLAGRLPPLDDELYYWCWSKDLQLSYYDHPPMTALLIRGSTELFGDTLFAIRFPACVATAAVLGVLGWLTRPRSILFGTVFSPLFTFGAVLVTPDTPLLLFWSLYLAWLVVVHRRLTPDDGGEPRRVSGLLWAVGGVILGCGILGKYTTGLAVPAGVVSFLLIGLGAVRRWAAGYAVHLLVAFAVASPILIHNLRHGFVPLQYQWGHAMAADEPGLKAVAEFVGLQVLFTGTLPLVLLPWIAWRFPRLAADPRLRVCACLYALPLAFFLWKSSRGPLEGNWAVVSYLAFWPVAAAWYGGLDSLGRGWRWFWKWGARLSFVAPAVSVAALGAHLVHPLPVVPVDGDRVTRQYDRNDLAAAFAEYVNGRPERLPVFTPEYQWTALLRFHRVDARQEPDITRPSHFTEGGDRLADHAAVYYFSNFPLPPGHADGFAPPRVVAEFPLYVRGQKYDTYKLWQYRRATPAATRPMPDAFATRPPP